MKTSYPQSKDIVKIADVLPFLPTQAFAGITQMEKTYTDLQFINVRKIIRGIKNFAFINHLLIMSKLSI
ncbi:hypothetical protein DJ93_1971 [Bacillus clarus]|uniref:Uncharacterized protein n=1 Tax=Bacillus clarus TaxID=2338372 RepID=A0A090YT00_9BACI|nr:hypothetical protein DJ93_1971 [Bacillus clarus]